MAISIKGTFRIQSIYQGEDRSYLTLKDKGDNSVVKVAVPNPLPKNVVDDGLISLDGALKPSLYSNNVSLSYEGVVQPVAEK